MMVILANVQNRESVDWIDEELDLEGITRLIKKQMDSCLFLELRLGIMTRCNLFTNTPDFNPLEFVWIS